MIMNNFSVPYFCDFVKKYTKIEQKNTKKELDKPKKDNEVLIMGKKLYEEMKLTLIRFDEADVLTYSENDYDNVGADKEGAWS